jgi:head-tail adaptor
MDGGNLDRRLQVLRAVLVDDGFSEALGVPAVIGTVWAAKRDISDGERFKDGAADAGLTTRFQVRWSEFTAGIRASDTLRCEGRAYGIAGIKEIGRREGLEITARAEGL